MFGRGYSQWVGGGMGHPGHRHGHGRGGMDEMERGRRGGRRLFDGGELKLLLLKLAEDQPRHGYDLIRAIEERTGGAYAPSPGVVYPTLTMLADMGLLDEVEGGGQRRTFGITDAGRTELADKAETVAALLARLDAVAEHRARTDIAPVKRAMHNLRQVLQHKLGEEAIDRDRMHQAVALIDEAAGKIERL